MQLGGFIQNSRTLLRRIAIGCTLAITSFFLFAPQTGAYNPYYDDFSRLSCRPLSMGQAGTALADDPSAIFFNPAALANQHRFALMHNHSSRHFPSIYTDHEVDQLNGDTQAIIVPLGPNITAGIGFNFQGEMGYDYSTLTGQDEFPLENLAMVERFEGLGFSLSPITQVGFARRSAVHRYSRIGSELDEIAEPRVFSPSYPGDIYPYTDDLEWDRVGDGYLHGYRQRVFPGLTYSNCFSKIDFDYNDDYDSRVTHSNSAWEFKPTGWLTFVWETETSIIGWGGPDLHALNFPDGTFFIRFMKGMELNLAGLARLRFGTINGEGTWGFEWTLPNLRLMYTEVTDYLDEIVGTGIEHMKNVHFYGFILYI